MPAVDKAIELARRFGAKLELFHAIATHVYTSFGLQDDQLEQLKNERLVQTLARVEAIAEAARKQGIEVKAATAWDFPPHEAIVRHALGTNADLIVAECHAGSAPRAAVPPSDGLGAAALQPGAGAAREGRAGLTVARHCLRQ